MATRSRTFLYVQYRNSFGHAQRRRRGGHGMEGGDGSVHAVEQEGLIEQTNEAGELVIELSHLPPRWADVVDDFNEQLEDAARKIKRLEGMHKSHLLPGFDDRSGEEREIEKLTHEITSQFQACSALVRSVAQHHQAHGQEQTVGRNIQSSLAQKLQERTAAFRQSQSAYMHKVSLRKDVSTDVFALDEDHDRATSRRFDMTLTDEQLLAIESNEAAIAEREGEIAKIHHSITELAAVFGQMQEMIIDQGTMLDRIDYNIENAAVNLASAADELQTADKYHKQTTANKCIIVLGVVVIVLVLVLIIKWI